MMIARRKALQHSPPIGLRMRDFGRARILNYLPSAGHVTSSINETQFSYRNQNDYIQDISKSDKEEGHAESEIASIQEHKTSYNQLPQEPRNGIPPDLLRILELHQSRETNEDEFFESSLPLQSVDLAEALSLNEQQRGSSSDYLQDHLRRPPRIQEVTPKQIESNRVSRSVEQSLRVNSGSGSNSASDPIKRDEDQVIELHPFDPQPILVPTISEKTSQQSVEPVDDTIADVETKDTNLFEAISQEFKNPKTQLPSEIVATSETFTNAIHDSDLMSLIQAEQVSQLVTVDDEDVHLNEFDKPGIEDYGEEDVPVIDQLNTAWPPKIQNWDHRLSDALSNNPNLPYPGSKDNSTLPIQDSTAVFRMPYSNQAMKGSSDGIIGKVNDFPGKSDDTSQSKHGFALPDKLSTYRRISATTNLPKIHTGESSASVLPMPKVMAVAKPVVNSSRDNRRSKVTLKDESTAFTIPNIRASEEGLLKLLNLPSDTPVMRPKTKGKQPDPDFSLPHVPANVMRSILPDTNNLLAETNLSSDKTQSLNETHSDTETSAVPPGVNIEKLSRRVYELLKERLRVEFERRFDNRDL